MEVLSKRNLSKASLELTETLIDYEVEIYLIKRRGLGMDRDVIVQEVQGILDSIFKPEVKIKVELDKLSGVCIIVYSHELQFEEVIKYIGKQTNKTDE
jgi:hypothetical protein